MIKDPEQNSRKHNVRCPAEKLLVISDNQELCLFLKEVLEINLFEHPLKVDFCYTAFNLNPKQMIEIGAKKVNLKDEKTINEMILNYDLVFSIHCKQIFPSRIVENLRCVNFHPGLNPYNRGWYPQVFSIVNGLPVGATIHLMDSEVDHGDIIAQKSVDIKLSDTSLDIYRKIIEAEKQLMRDNVFDIIEGVFDTKVPEHEGNYNSLSDYKALCKLNLKSIGTFGEHLNVLRATTHGNFKNAYFIDESNNKYYVRVVIEEECSTQSET